MRELKIIICLLVVFAIMSLTACGDGAKENTNISSKTNSTVSNESIDSETYDSDNTVLFGKYEQDNNISNGKEKIKWLIIGTNVDNVLLLSDKILSVNQFDNNDNKDWSTSSIRQWLNDDFYNNAFSEEEKDMIKLTTVTTPIYANILSGGQAKGVRAPDPCPDTMDKVFLISAQEVEKYLINTEYLKAEYSISAEYEDNYLCNSDITKFNSNHWTSIQSAWLLRSSGPYWEFDNTNGMSHSHILCVSQNPKDGSPHIFNIGFSTWDYLGIRPAIYVSKSLIEK